VIGRSVFFSFIIILILGISVYSMPLTFNAEKKFELTNIVTQGTEQAALRAIPVKDTGFKQSFSFNIRGNINDNFYTELNYNDQLKEKLKAIKLFGDFNKFKIFAGDIEVENNSRFIADIKKIRGGKIISSLPNINLEGMVAVVSSIPFRDVLYGKYRTGPYFLTHKPIVSDSEKVFVDDVLLTRNYDYYIDYQEGIINFNDMILGTSVIEVTYDYENPAIKNTRVIKGVKSEIKLAKNVEMEICYLNRSDSNENNIEDITPAAHHLIGIKEKVKIHKNWKVNFEWAHSIFDKNTLVKNPLMVDSAYYLENSFLFKNLELTLNYKKIGDNFIFFDNSKENSSIAGILKFGGKSLKKLSGNISFERKYLKKYTPFLARFTDKMVDNKNLKLYDKLKCSLYYPFSNSSTIETNIKAERADNPDNKIGYSSSFKLTHKTDTTSTRCRYEIATTSLKSLYSHAVNLNTSRSFNKNLRIATNLDYILNTENLFNSNLIVYYVISKNLRIQNKIGYSFDKKDTLKLDKKDTSIKLQYKYGKVNTNYFYNIIDDEKKLTPVSGLSLKSDILSSIRLFSKLYLKNWKFPNITLKTNFIFGTLKSGVGLSYENSENSITRSALFDISYRITKMLKALLKTEYKIKTGIEEKKWFETYMNLVYRLSKNFELKSSFQLKSFDELFRNADDFNVYFTKIEMITRL